MIPITLSFRPIVSFRPTGGILLQRGLGKACLRTECRQVHQLFGDKLNTIIEELNETLAA
jgi:hypothetical protein